MLNHLQLERGELVQPLRPCVVLVFWKGYVLEIRDVVGGQANRCRGGDPSCSRSPIRYKKDPAIYAHMVSRRQKDGEQHDVHVCDAVKATVGRGNGEEISVHGLYIVAVPLSKHAL